MALFDKLRNDGTLSLKGNPGPAFENEGQKTSSNIQALASNNILIESQDLTSGRTYGNNRDRVRIAPSELDLNGKTPQQYVNVTSGDGSAQQSSTFNSSTGTGFLLEKRLPFSRLGLQGLPGETFENESQRATSDIQALAKNNILHSSQDLSLGRRYGKGRFTVFIQPSNLDTGGNPFYPAINGGTYRDKGPREGIY